MDDDLDQELEALRKRIVGEQYGTPYCFLCGVDCNLGFGFLRVQSSTNVLDVTTPEDPEASEDEIVARMLERPKRPGVSLNCAVCRLHFDSHTHRGQHEKDHAKKRGGWRCSCCGVYERTREQRAAHEISMHGFQRGSPAEASRRGPSGARDDLTRVGSNFDEVQEAARQPDESSGEEEAGDNAIE
ncbi:hypothetical protein M3Y99_00383100 [Aphelenchoides fujianensis]|nr:hypothetical protein M3Y99_00383100 [Aphelenchoides fujianensis]